MAKDSVRQGRLSALTTLRARLDAVTIVGKPLTWFVTGWRLYSLLFIAAVIYPQFVGNYGALVPSQPNEALVTAGVFVGMYVLLALGLNIVVGYAGLLDLGYVAFFALGAYTVGVFTEGHILASDGKTVVPLPQLIFWLALPLAAIIASVAGILLGAPTLRLRGDYLAIVTLGFGEIIPIFFTNVPWFGSQDGVSANGPPDGAGITFTNPTNNIPFYYLVLALVILVIFAVRILRDSSIGRAWIAIREDETAASASGVNLVRTKLLAFALGALVGGVGGALYAGSTGTISSRNFDFSISILVLVMIVLGGIGSILGVILGAVLLEFFDVYLLGQINDNIHNSALVLDPGAPLHFLSNFDFNFSKYLIYGLLLLIMILLRPQGLLPNTRRQRELRGVGASAEGTSAIGLLEREEAGDGGGPEQGGGDDSFSYAGPGSDAAGREG